MDGPPRRGLQPHGRRQRRLSPPAEGPEGQENGAAGAAAVATATRRRTIEAIREAIPPLEKLALDEKIAASTGFFVRLAGGCTF